CGVAGSSGIVPARPGTPPMQRRATGPDHSMPGRTSAVAAAMPPGSVVARRLTEGLPGEVQRVGHVGGVDRGRDDQLQVVAAPPDPAVHVHGDGRALLLGEAALELLTDGTPRALSANPGHAEADVVARQARHSI